MQHGTFGTINPRNKVIMKRIIAVALFATMTFILKAQEVVCHLPKTQVCIYVTYEVTHSTPGMFYQYSERYLGTKDIVLTEHDCAKLVKIELGTSAVADSEKTYTFIPGEQGLNVFSISREGILRSLNVTEEKQHDKKSTEKPKKMPDENLPSLSEEVLLASSTAKMAEGIAKQIYRLREVRLNLLSGEVDKIPADGNSMQQVLQEIRRQENELTALFIGTKKTITKHERIIIDIDEIIDAESHKENEIVAFRFSPVTGIVNANDLSGTPYYLSVKNIYCSAKPVSSKKTPPMSSIMYCVPGSALFTLSDGNKELAKKVLQLTQLGYTTALPLDFIKKNPIVNFDYRTGALLNTSK